MQHNYDGDIAAYRPRAVALSKRIRHRGPDWSGCVTTKDSILCHERLAIVGVDTGAQPLTNEDGTLILAVNGEIYNHKALRKGLKNAPVFKTHSDCEVIMHLVSSDYLLCIVVLLSGGEMTVQGTRSGSLRDAGRHVLLRPTRHFRLSLSTHCRPRPNRHHDPLPRLELGRSSNRLLFIRTKSPA